MPALKLFTGQPTVDQRSLQFWTIRQAFEQQARPRLKRQNRSPGTIAKWEKAVWYWETVRPDDPPIGAIASDDLTAFPELLLDPANKLGITTHTAANQQLMYVSGILRACADHLERVPKGDRLPQQAATRHRRAARLEDLSELYRGARSANLSKDPQLPAPLVWQSILVLMITVGCRRCEGLKMPASAWHRAPEFPDLPGLDLDAESPHGWLVFHTPKTASRKGGLPLVLPVASVLADHLRELDRLSPRRLRMFPVGDHPSAWRKQFNRIHRKVGISPEFTWQDLRKTANRIYRRAAGRDVASFMLGHQPRGVNATYYDDLTEDAVEAVRKVTWPSAFYSRE